MSWFNKFIDLFSRRSTRTLAVAAIGVVCGFFVSKAQVFSALGFLATPLFLVSLVGLPVLIWRNSPEGRKASRKILSLIGYFFVFSIPFGIGNGISVSTPIGNEKSIRSEIAARENEEALERSRQQAERKRQQEIQAQRAADEKAIAARQKRLAEEEALKQYDLSMSVKQISSEFTRNSARAEDQLKGKRIRVTGFAGQIDDGPFSENSVLFQITDGEFLGGSVRCVLKRSNKAYQRFDRGQPMVMIGTLAGEEAGVRFDKCYFP